MRWQLPILSPIYLTGVSSLPDLNREFLRVQRLDNQRSSVLMLDLDLFKEVNDTYGHAAGDAVLKHFAQQMRNGIRKIDTAGRLGGEEFAIIIPGADFGRRQGVGRAVA